MNGKRSSPACRKRSWGSLHCNLWGAVSFPCPSLPELASEPWGGGCVAPCSVTHFQTRPDGEACFLGGTWLRNTYCLAVTHCAFLSCTCSVGTKCAILRALHTSADIQIVVHRAARAGCVCVSSITKNYGKGKNYSERSVEKSLAILIAVFYCMLTVCEN